MVEPLSDLFRKYYKAFSEILFHRRDAEDAEALFFCWIGRPQRNKLRIPQGRRRSNKSLQPCGLISLLIFKFSAGKALIILPRSGRGLFAGRRLPPGEKIILLCVCASNEQREWVVHCKRLQRCNVGSNFARLISLRAFKN